MNNQADNDSDIVSENYRASSTETAPAELDHAVLREASRATVSGRLSGFYSWYRPLAFAATLVIGVALVYDIQKALNEADAPSMPMPESFEDAATAPEVRQDAAPAARSAKPSFTKPGAEPTTTAPARAASKPAIMPASEAADSGGVPDSPRGKQASQESLRLAPPVGERKVELLRSTADMAAMPDPDAGICTGAYRDSAQQWWRCVEHLKSTGDSDAADAELQQLREKYPQFAVTE